MSPPAASPSAAARWPGHVARAIVAVCASRLPALVAQRYREEWEADLAELERRGALVPVVHALGLLWTAPSFAVIVVAPVPPTRRAYARRVLAHFGLARDPRRSEPEANGSYVFTGHLAWRPLGSSEPGD